MAGEAAAIADLLKADIDGQSWPVTLASFREYMTPVQRSTLGITKRLSIFPYTHQIERGVGRGSATRTHGVAVVLRASVEPEDITSVDPLVETLEDIADRYTITPLGDGVPQTSQMILGDQLYDIDQLADSRLFVGGIIINYQTRT